MTSPVLNSAYYSARDHFPDFVFVIFTVLFTFAMTIPLQLPWDHVPPVLVILLCLMGLDIVTGNISAWINGVVSSKAGGRGLMRKGLILLLLLSADLMEKAVGSNYHLQRWGALAYCANEFISIIENCDKCGVPIPGWLVKALLSAKQFRFNQATPEEIAALRTDDALKSERALKDSK